MMLQSSRLGSLPFSDVLGGLVASLYTWTTASTLTANRYYGEQFIDDDGYGSNEVTGSKSVDPLEWEEWQLWWFDDYLLDAGDQLVLSCVCTSSLLREPSHHRYSKKQRTPTSSSSRRRSSSFLTFAVVAAALQLFLYLTRVNAAVLPLLPTTTVLSREAALALVTGAGVLGSALATRRFGREATFAGSAALIVFCQVGVPALVGAHAGLGGVAGSTAMLLASCAVSCSLGWSWGALFWASPGPGEGIRSAGPAVLGFAQMHCSLLTLRRLRHAALAFYAARIWS